VRALLALVLVVTAASCGTAPCKGAACTTPADAGPRPACGGGCSGLLSICDAEKNACVACSATQGCGGLSPVCDTSVPSGACVACTATAGCTGGRPHCLIDGLGRRCVECRTRADCSPGETCDTAHRCRAGGSPDDGGADAGHGEGADAGPDAGPDNAGVDGGVCPPRKPPVPCGMECQPGFQCIGGQCVLNGGQGPVQVTLRWNTDEDVDLHLLEPVPGGAPCDVFYGNAQGSLCGARGALDLDSNASCNIDGVGIENIVYDPVAGAPSGVYTVLVDHYANCSPATTWVAYEVEVRVGGTISGSCGAFLSGGPGWNNGGGANSGTPVMTFVVP
jgi:hypothetical protein